MIWTFILGALAGWFAPLAEDSLRPLIEANLPGRKLSPAEMRAIALSACILVAALVAVLSGAGGAIPLALGAVIGVLGPRLRDRVRAMRAPDYES
ncbi:MAG: hypothetical protein LJE62_07355 [Silicimonas sp.]|jgi:hypothetical protein|nr:hypothetical protein [Silicimonas sp.]